MIQNNNKRNIIEKCEPSKKVKRTTCSSAFFQAAENEISTSSNLLNPRSESFLKKIKLEEDLFEKQIPGPSENDWDLPNEQDNRTQADEGADEDYERLRRSDFVKGQSSY